MKTTFTSTCRTLDKYDGEVEIIRKLTLEEADIESQPMFRVKSGDEEFDAFADELAAFPEYTNDYVKD